MRGIRDAEETRSVGRVGIDDALVAVDDLIAVAVDQRVVQFIPRHPVPDPLCVCRACSEIAYPFLPSAVVAPLCGALSRHGAPCLQFSLNRSSLGRRPVNVLPLPGKLWTSITVPHFPQPAPESPSPATAHPLRSACSGPRAGRLGRRRHPRSGYQPPAR